jgi:hypothetical protein
LHYQTIDFSIKEIRPFLLQQGKMKVKLPVYNKVEDFSACGMVEVADCS